MSAAVQGNYLGSYRLTATLGEGSFGVVYRAYQPFLERDVAIKTIQSDLIEDPRMEKLFMNEGRTIARLRHPNIVSVYECGIAPHPTRPENVAFLVMEYLPGETLFQKMQRRLLPLPDGVHLIQQLAQGLHYAHQADVVHRDLKPANILFTQSGQPVIVDFGLAKLQHLDKVNPATELSGPAVQPEGSLFGSSISGTPRYMAPEQMTNDPSTPATDQYALALIAYEVLAGKYPFEAAEMWDEMQLRLTQLPPPVQQFRPELSPKIDAVLQRALSVDAANRFPDVEQFAEALADAALPNRQRERIVKVIDPVQAAQMKTAWRMLSGFLTVLGVVMTIIILYCSSLFLRSYLAGSSADFLWDGLVVQDDRLPDGHRLVTGVFPGSAAEMAGYKVGDVIEDDVLRDREKPNASFAVNGKTRDSLNIGWEPKPNDVITRTVTRNGQAITISYALRRDLYVMLLLVAALVPAAVSLWCGFWLLRQWGAEPGIQIVAPLYFATSFYFVLRVVQRLIPYADTLVYHIMLASLLHVVLVFPEPVDWFKRHPNRIWWIYAPGVVGLYSFLTASPIILPGGLRLQILDYFLYLVAIAAAVGVKWVRHERLHYPALHWIIAGVTVTVATGLVYVLLRFAPFGVIQTLPGSAVGRDVLLDIILILVGCLVPIMTLVGFHRVQKQIGSTFSTLQVTSEAVT